MAAATAAEGTMGSVPCCDADTWTTGALLQQQLKAETTQSTLLEGLSPLHVRLSKCTLVNSDIHKLHRVPFGSCKWVY